MYTKFYHLLLLIIVLGMFNACDNTKNKKLAASDVYYCPVPVNDKIQIKKSQVFVRHKFNPKEWKKIPELLVVGIKSIENPNLEALSFSVHLETPQETVELGRFSLYPPDTPGFFNFRINQHTEKLQHTHNAYIIVKFVPLEKQVLSRKVKVTFYEFSWE